MADARCRQVAAAAAWKALRPAFLAAVFGSVKHLRAMQEVPVTYVVPSSEQDSPEGTDEDEELQRALRLSIAEQQQQQSRSPPSAGGAGAGLQQAPPPEGSAWAALPPAEHGGSWGSLGAASAPPLPDDQADWAEGFWRQQPGWQDGSDSEQQRPDAAAAAAAAAAADAAARYDEQLAADEALAQSLHEQELRQLSGEDRGAGSGWGWLGVVCSAWFVQAGGLLEACSWLCTARDSICQGFIPLAAHSHSVPTCKTPDHAAERLRRLPALLAETPLVRRMSETLASLSGGSFSKVRLQLMWSDEETSGDEAWVVSQLMLGWPSFGVPNHPTITDHLPPW